MQLVAQRKLKKALGIRVPTKSTSATESSHRRRRGRLFCASCATDLDVLPRRVEASRLYSGPNIAIDNHDGLNKRDAEGKYVRCCAGPRRRRVGHAGYAVR